MPNSHTIKFDSDGLYVTSASEDLPVDGCPVRHPTEFEVCTKIYGVEQMARSRPRMRTGGTGQMCFNLYHPTDKTIAGHHPRGNVIASPGGHIVSCNQPLGQRFVQVIAYSCLYLGTENNKKSYWVLGR